MSFTTPKSHLHPRANFTNPFSLLFPLLFSAEWPILRIIQFTPRQLIYSKDVLPFLFAPWSWPTCHSAVLSRLIQAALLSRLPNDLSSVKHYYALWTLVALARTLSGFLLTRSVGWAYPRLFAHFALYETTGGLGPALIAYLILTGNRTFADLFTSPSSTYTLETRNSLVIIALCAVLSWLDGAPWSYAMATICAAGLAVLRALFNSVIRSRHHHPMTLDPHPEKKTLNHLSQLHTVLRVTLLSLLLLPQPSLIGRIIHPSHEFLAVPPSPNAPSPLLEILILSHPRPTDQLLYNATNPPTIAVPSSILYTTICSYLPFLSAERDSSTRLSVFTHTLPHHAFTHAKHFLSLDMQNQHTNVRVEFHADLDQHPDAHSNQYLHLSEALRWVEGKSGGRDDKSQAEWILLVEDDFALCGVWGWDGLVRVMQRLESGRRVVNGIETLDRLGGFVATGGSGLIIHRTLLPILSFILRTHASINSPLPRHIPPRPADLIIQDCLLGIDPLCPQPLSKSNAEFLPPKTTTTTIHDNESGGGPLVITSRLVMDHIGSTASTTLGRVYSSEKWRCGWRHPFHGRDEVDVIAV